MRYVELIFCKLAWLEMNTTPFWRPRYLSISRSFMGLLFPIFTISISSVVLVLTAWGVKNGRNLLCNSELSSNFAPA